MLNTREQVNTADAKLGANQQLGPATFNSNTLLKGTEEGTKNFAEQLNDLQKAAVNQQFNNQELVSQLPEANNTLLQEQAEKIASVLQEHGIKIDSEMAKKLLEQRKLDLSKEQQTTMTQEIAAHEAEEMGQKHAVNEAAVATAAQANQEEVQEAVKEGNAGEQEQEADQDDGNDRKAQLANWDKLAPRVIEDIKNKAVRIDIPGLNDISTIIVKIKGNQVSVQAVGSGSAMKMLQAGQGELNSRLSNHGVQLSDLKAYDAKQLRKKKKSA